jgi:hypothetical protein
MIEYLTTFGKVKVFSKEEFLQNTPVEMIRIGTSKVNYPNLVFNVEDSSSLFEGFGTKIVNVEYDLTNNLGFNHDTELHKLEIESYIARIRALTGRGELNVVLVGGYFYIYVDPEIIKDTFGNFQVICKGNHNVRRVKVENSDIKGISMVKATDLAKFMYPDASISDCGEWMYLC